MKRLSMLLAALGLTACAGAGAGALGVANKAQQLRAGTSPAEVRAVLGDPGRVRDIPQARGSPHR